MRGWGAKAVILTHFKQENCRRRNFCKFLVEIQGFQAFLWKSKVFKVFDLKYQNSKFSRFSRLAGRPGSFKYYVISILSCDMVMLSGFGILVYDLKLKSHTKILKFNHFRGQKQSQFDCISKYGFLAHNTAIFCPNWM